MKDQILKLQTEFDRAELTADLDTLRRLLADDFLSIGPKGFVLDKNAWIGRHAQFKYHSLDSSEVDVRAYGSAAIVRNVQRNRASYQGHEQEHAVRVSQVWVRLDNDWKLAGIQFSPLAQV
ncbi:MAG: nuclear transport factor 2 family protein [Deltaproteobacteria bacterium]